MNKPKIIFFDVDGTLVPLKGAARPRTLEALRRLHQNASVSASPPGGLLWRCRSLRGCPLMLS